LEDIVAFLVETPLFEHLDELELSELVHALEIVHLSPGETLFRSGDPADAWYVVFQGRIGVFREDGEGLHHLADLGPRAAFGEMAALDGSHRSATARASEPTWLLRLPTPTFHGALRAGAAWAYKLVHRMALMLVARVRALNAELATAGEPLRVLEVLRLEDAPAADEG
jgi:CRP-like cAMP-binding protein